MHWGRSPSWRSFTGCGWSEFTCRRCFRFHRTRSQLPSLRSYLTFSCSPQARAATAASQSRTFSDLVQRCLSTTPSRLERPFNPAEFWSCYRFHNKVRGRVRCHTPSSPA